jgi:hypothetical protein
LVGRDIGNNTILISSLLRKVMTAQEYSKTVVVALNLARSMGVPEEEAIATALEQFAEVKCREQLDAWNQYELPNGSEFKSPRYEESEELLSHLRRMGFSSRVGTLDQWRAFCECLNKELHKKFHS